MISNKSRVFAILLALLLLASSFPAVAAETSRPIPVRKAAPGEFANKPIDLLGELTYADKKITSFKLGKTNISLSVGQTYRIKLLIKGTGSKPNFGTFDFSTSPAHLIDGVMIRDSNSGDAVFFEIVGIKPGTLKMTVSLENKKASAKVTVKNPALRLSSSTLSLLAGQSAQLNATMYPDPSPTAVTWKSSNQKIASVASDGTVVAKKKGSVTISAKLGNHTATCAVRVESTPMPGSAFDYVLNTASDGETYVVIRKYKGNSAHVIIPDTIKGHLVRRIGPTAFAKKSALKSVVLPSSLLEINEFAFADCHNLQTVVVPDTLTDIDECAFENCRKLRDIELPPRLSYLGIGAFYRCFSLRELNIPGTLETIPEELIEGGYGLRNLTISEGVMEIDDSAFRFNFVLNELRLPSTLKSIGDNAFECCETLRSVTIPDRITRIGYATFLKCYALSEVHIGSGVTTISDGAFAYCESLTDIVIPKTVRNIEPDAFYGTSGIIIHGESGSYAEQFAAEQCFPFVAR